VAFSPVCRWRAKVQLADILLGAIVFAAHGRDVVNLTVDVLKLRASTIHISTRLDAISLLRCGGRERGAGFGVLRASFTRRAPKC